MEEQLWEYSKKYTKPVDAEWVARQFKLYDQYVKNYYLSSKKLFNEYNGLSYDDGNNKVAKIEYLAKEVNLGDVHIKLCGDDDLVEMM